MAIIYSYPNGSSALASDTLTITRSSIDSPVPNPTFTLTVAQIAAFVQSQLAGGTPNYIPVFNTSNTIIDSSMYLDDFAAPALLTIGHDTKIQGNLTLEQDQADTTLTLVSDGSNVGPGGEQHNPSIKFIQDGGAQNAAVGFNIIDDTGAGTLPGTGNRFWIVNAMEDTVGEGGITFGTAQVDGWDNAIGRFIIRGDGKGLFGHPDSLYNKILGSQFEIYDNRNDNTTTDASFSVYSVLDVAAPSGNEGAGGIKQILDVYDNGVFSQQEALMLIPGTSASDFAASTPIAFYTNSDMDTASPSGFAGIIFDSGNWLLDGSGTFTTVDPGYQLTVDGSQWLKGALYDGNELPGTAGQVLSSTGTGVEWTSGGTGSIGGSGTLDTIAMFTPDGTTIGDSDIIRTGLNAYQINSSLTVPTNLTTTNFYVSNIFAGDSSYVGLNGTVQIGNAGTDILTVNSTATFNGDVVVDGNFLELQTSIKDATANFPSASGQILVGDSQGSVIWTNPQDVGISGAFREVNEGNGIGIVKTTRNPNNYASIGNEAFDASHSGSPSSTRGASGAYSVALGENVIASGNNSFAFGKGVRAFADHDIVLGHDTEATGGHSTAIGWESTASGVVSTAIGYFANASGDNSVAIGWRVDATGSESNVFGKYNLTTDELFVVGNGDNSQRSDLIVGKSDGVILAPSLDINEILDPKCLITLEYLQQSTGNVSGTGQTNFLPLWIDGPNSVLGDSIVKEEPGTAYNTLKNLVVNGNIYQSNMGQSVSIGEGALENGASGVFSAENVAIGQNALNSLTTATNNIGIGAFALSSTNENNNIAIGKNSQLGQTTGLGNISLGFNSLSGNLVGNTNIVIGHTAVQNVGTGTQGIRDNVILGTGAVNATTITNGLAGSVIIGQNAFNEANATYITKAIAIGENACNFMTGNILNDIGIGFSAFYGNNNGFDSAGDNIAIGSNANGSNSTSGVVRSIKIGSDSGTAGSYSVNVSAVNTNNYGVNYVLGEHAAIIGGANNSIQNAEAAFTGGGRNNTIAAGATGGAIIGGFDNTVNGSGSAGMALGSNLEVSGANQVVLGRFNTANNNSKLIVGAGFSNANRINALEVKNTSQLKLGKYGQGNFPQSGSVYNVLVASSTGNVNEVPVSDLNPQLMPATSYTAVPGSVINVGGILTRLIKISWGSVNNGTAIVRLPIVSNFTNKTLQIITDGSFDAGAGKKIDIQGSFGTGDTIDGVASFELSKKYEGISLWSDGTEWFIIQAKAH